MEVHLGAPNTIDERELPVGLRLDAVPVALSPKTAMAHH